MPDASRGALPRVFFDLDGVIVDFEGFLRQESQALGREVTGDEVKRMVGAYLAMQPIEGAIAGVRSAIGMGYDVWLATKPPTGIAHAYADKAQRVFIHLPEFKRKLILTHDKGMLGDPGDVLVDDHPHRANCRAFKGTLIEFGGAVGWPQVLEVLRTRRAVFA